MRIVFSYFIIFLKARLEYRFDFITGILTSLTSYFSGLLFNLFLLDGVKVTSLGTWSRSEVIFIYGYSLLPLGLFGILAMNLYMFSDKYIIQGAYDRVLLRPLPGIVQVLFESFNIDALGGLLGGIIVLYYTSAGAGVTWGVSEISWVILSSICGAIIMASVFITVASISFHIEDKFGISAPIYNLMTFGRYPINIFGFIIQVILSCIIPFGFVAFYPATFFFKNKGFETFAMMTPVVALITLVIAILSWRFGERSYSSVGS